MPQPCPQTTAHAHKTTIPQKRSRHNNRETSDKWILEEALRQTSGEEMRGDEENEKHGELPEEYPKVASHHRIFTTLSPDHDAHTQVETNNCVRGVRVHACALLAHMSETLCFCFFLKEGIPTNASRRDS